jgi:hypothetical protein
MASNTPGPSVTRNERTDRFLQALNGCPVTPALGVITGTAATSNGSTAAPFTLVGGTLYLLQADTACYVATGATSAAALLAVTGSSATVGGFLFDPAYGPSFLVMLQPADTAIAMVPVTGTTNLKVFTQV